MNLGERLFTLRTQKNLSQGDLAEKLNVSRQSVSKWENNSAVPELDKIIRMSEIFGVTVDELVKENAQPKEEKIQQEPTPAVVQVVQREPMEKRILAGIILLSLGGLAFLLLLLLTGLGCIYALPVLLCGAVCFVCKKDTAFYCTWLVYLLVTGFLSFATAVSSWRVIRYTLQGPYNGNPAIIIIAWVWFAAMLGIMVWSVVKFAKRPVEKIGKSIALCVVGAVYLLADLIIGRMVGSYYMQLAESNSLSSSFVYGVGTVNSVLTILEPVFATLVLVQGIRLLLCFYKKKKSVFC
ncbi:MAG: helix-turn-helix domain-containing protein [Ruminococcaceae bacterium]|nr:helix-turn-helix domain-containing protein [Oscillospiraceae bacterium]